MELETDFGLTGMDTLCMICAMTPCVCLLTTLPGGLTHLAEQENKEEEAQAVHGQEASEEARGGGEDDRNTNQVTIIMNYRKEDRGTRPSTEV